MSESAGGREREGAGLIKELDTFKGARRDWRREEVKDGGLDSDVLLTTCSLPAAPSF